MEIPELGSFWKHKNSNSYLVTYVSNDDVDPSRADEYPLTISYQGNDGKRYSRTIDRWLSMTRVSVLDAHLENLKLLIQYPVDPSFIQIHEDSIAPFFQKKPKTIRVWWGKTCLYFDETTNKVAILCEMDMRGHLIYYINPFSFPEEG